MSVRLSWADSLMAVQPDSTYGILLSMQDEAAHCGRRKRMLHHLLLAEAMNTCDIPFTSDSLGWELVHYYDHWWHSHNYRI